MRPGRDPPVLMAAWVGEAAHSIIGAGGEGRVHGVYTGAVNLAMRGGMVCLLPETSERGPINVNIPLPSGRGISSFGLEPGDTVRAEGTTLDLGGRLLVSTISARRYSPRKSFSPVHSGPQLERNLEAARRTGLAHGNLSGLGELLSPDEARGIFASAAAARVSRLSKAVRAGDARTTGMAVSDLLGLGPGLTPSSDDMLAGMALFMVLYSRSTGTSTPGREAAVRAVARRGPRRTTALSEAYLKEAAAGRGNEGVLALCEALLTRGEEAVVRESRRLLEVGETSGTDTLLGVLLGGDLCAGGRSPW